MEEMMDRIQQWGNENCLLYIKVLLKEKGRHMLVGRVISLDRIDKSVLIYVDDKKEVESYKFSEIDDIVPATGEI